MLTTSDKTSQIMEAYLKIQDDLLIFKKDTAGVKNTYASYETLVEKIKPLLTKSGIALFQPLGMFEGEKAIFTRIQKGEEWMQSVITITEIPMLDEEINSAQRDGMSITYMKRYSLGSFFAIGTGEKDLDSATIEEDTAKRMRS